MEVADRIITHVVKNPHEGCPDTKITIGVFYRQPIVIIQDSKHGLKTFCKNLFSGAHLLTLGNYTAVYNHIEELAYEAGTPQYYCDVHKLDCQDDNAAIIDFTTKHHPDYLSEIIYLFIFSELIDAYQKWAMAYQE